MSSFVYTFKNALRCLNRSYWSSMRLKSCAPHQHCIKLGRDCLAWRRRGGESVLDLKWVAPRFRLGGRVLVDFTYRCHTRMISHHNSTNSIPHRPLPCESHLNARRTPRYKVRQLPLSDPQQRLVHVGRVHVAGDDVQAGDVTGGFCRCCRDHTVFGLEQAAHDVEGRCLACCFGLRASERARTIEGEGGSICRRVVSWCMVMGER